MSTAHIIRCYTNVLLTMHYDYDYCYCKGKAKGKGFPYSIPSAGTGADPSVQAVSLQVTVSHPPAVGCHYFLPGLRLPPQPQSITALWPVPSYTAWWQRQIGMNNLPKVVTQRCPEQDLNPRPIDRKSNPLPLAPLRHHYGTVPL